MNQMKKEELEMTISDSDRIECAIRHIQTSFDVDPWAAEIAVEAMRKQLGLKSVPSAEAERKTGKWLKTGQSFVFPDKFRNYFCSECGFEIEKTAYNYCPNCGAKMEGINVLQSKKVMGRL